MIRNDNQRLSPRQKRAVSLLIFGRNQQDTAAQIGVTPVTMSRWMAQPLFREALNRSSDQAISSAAFTLAAGAETALTQLYTLMSAEGTAPHVRLRAIQIWLDMLLKFREQVELTNRLNSLNERLDALLEAPFSAENRAQKM